MADDKLWFLSVAFQRMKHYKEYFLFSNEWAQSLHRKWDLSKVMFKEK
ncbi:hypothetical protein JOC85_003484 [Bacillus mesophilus]|nr:hypothetical protein [Bacillus mesophilus]MBM7662674.1 hypothetical protein [Bacillus mesophilus]